MGIVSIGVVAMGVVNAAVVGMGIFSAGITTMGINVWSPKGAYLQQIVDNNNPLLHGNIHVYPTAVQAETQAKKLGCLGVHKMGDSWKPCAHHVDPE